MINNYTNLSSRSGTWLNKQTPEVVGNAPNYFGLSKLLFTLMIVFLSLFSTQDVTSQVAFTQNFDANSTGWTGFTRFTGTTACGGAGGAMRMNLYSSVTSGTLASPLVGSSLGGQMTISYSYKAANWSANTVGTNPWGSFAVQYASSASGPWTTIATVSQETQNGSCINKSHTFSPPAGSLYVRFAATWTAGDYYLNFDNVVISEAAAVACSGTPAPGNTIASSTSPCAGSTVNFSLQNVTPGTGVTYQWYNSAGMIAGATSGTYSTVPSGTSSYYCNVTCSGVTTSSTPVTVTPSIISTFPWTEGFEGVSIGSTVVGTSTNLPSCWNSQSTQYASSNATTYNTPRSGSNYLRYSWSTTNAFMWTPGFQLTAGTAYDFSFYAAGDGFTGWNNDVFVNSSVSSTGATQLTPTYVAPGSGTIAIQPYVKVTRRFIPTTSGVYYFAIRGNQSSGSPWYMAFDDFRLEQVQLCSGTPNNGTITISQTSGCSGGSLSFTSSGLSAGDGITYQWQSSTDNFATPGTNVGTGETFSATSVSGTTYYRLATICSNSGITSYSNVVSFNGIACGSVNLPANGLNSTVDCGTSTLIYDNGGPTGDYSVSTDSYVILDNSGTGVITLSGAITGIESCCDYLRVYSGAGTGGTQLLSANTVGNITTIVSNPGEVLTVLFHSDISVVGSGIALQALYSGTCLTCTTAVGGTATAATPMFCNSGSTTISATGQAAGTGTRYQWESSTDNFATAGTLIGSPSSSYTNLNTGTLTTTTSYRLRVFCISNPSDVAFSSVATVMINFPGTINPVSGDMAICPSESTTLSASASAPATFAWTATGGYSASGESVTVNPTSTTVYTVTATFANTCTASTTATVTVAPAVTMNGVTSSVSTICGVGSTTLTANASTPVSAYCDSTHSSGCSGDDVTNVVLGSINNPTTGCGGTSHYTYFNPSTSTTTTTLSPGSSTISVSFGTDSNQYFGAWIDYNQDGSFDASEFLGASANAGSSGTTSVTFTVPANALNGATRLRLIAGNDSALSATQACGASSSPWGETQDYNVTITGGVTPFTYVWTENPVGSTLNSTTTNPTTASGISTSKVYTVTATSGYGCTASGEVSVTANPTPVVTLADNITICKGTPATIFIPETGNSYAWSPADGLDTTSGATVVANPTTDTTYSVLITNNTTNCQNTQQITVDVNDAGSIVGQPSNAVTSTGFGASFTVAGSPSVTYGYQWQRRTATTPAPDGTWVNITDDYVAPSTGNYTGANTATLNVFRAGTAPAVNNSVYRCILTPPAPCANLVSTNATLTVGTTGIVTNPQNLSICLPASTNPLPQFNVVTNGSTPTSLVWSVSTNGGVSYTTMPMYNIGTGAYTGPNTTAVPGLTFAMPVDGSNPLLRDYKTLTVSGINGTTPNNLRFRVTINTFVVSQPAILNISSPAVIDTDLSTAPVKVCYTPTATPTTFTVAASGGVSSVVWKYATTLNAADAAYTDVVNNTPAGVTYATSSTSGSYSLTVSTTAGTTPLGNYYYKAFVVGSGACPTVTSSQATISVVRPTIAVASSSPVYCSPGTGVTLTASGSDAGTYAWSSTPAGYSNTGAAVTVTPTVATVYTVTGTDLLGCTNTATASVTVGGAFTASVSANTNTVCPSAPVILTGAASTLNPVYSGLVGAYTFATSTGATLDDMTGATTLTGASNDDTPAAGVALPFTFNFNGVGYTFFSASPDGFIRLANTNATASSQFSNAVTSTTNIPKIYPLWDDLATGTDGWVKTVTRGTAPNRIVVVEWRVTVPRNTSGASNSNFQAWLYEGTNKIEFRYGSIGTTGSGSAGLTGTAAQYQSITYSTNTTSNSAANNSLTTPPASGRMYTFLPPVQDSNTYSYAWTSTPAGFTASGISATASPSVNTTYNLTVTSQSGCTAQATKAISVDSAPPVLSTLAATQDLCQGGTATYTITATSATPVTYQWFRNGSPLANGSGITGVTTPTLTITGATPANSGNYTVNVTNCSTVTSNTSVLTVNPLPTATVTGNVSVCQNDAAPSVTFTGANGTAPYTFTYKLNGGANQTITSSGNSATLSVATGAFGTFAYSLVSVQDSSSTTCSQAQTGTATVIVNALPAVPVLSSNSPVCEGSALNLSAAITLAPATIVTQNFESGLGAWTVTSGSTGGSNPAVANFNIRAHGWASGTTFNSPGGSNFLLADPDNAGSGITLNTQLTSPSFSTVGYSNATLTFRHYHRYLTTAPTVQLSTDGGATWTNTLASYSADQGTATGFVTATISLNAYLGQSNVKIRYNYTGGWLWYWAIDDIAITGTPLSYSYAWSGPNGFTSTTQNPSIAGATPAASGTYTLEITNGNGCKASSTVNTTVHPTPTAVAPADQLFYNGLATAAIPLSGTPSGVTFDISGGAAIGLANVNNVTAVPSFVPSVGSATVSITPKANGCTGATVTFNIVVTAVNANPIANQQYCEGITTSAIALSSTPATVVGYPITYNMNVVGDDIGLYSATGLTEIPAFVTKPGSATITVYPVYGGVFGGATTATITVNPLPTATISGSTAVCRNDVAPLITFTGANGTAPYTFTYKFNGGANQTIVSLGNVATIAQPTGSAGSFTYTLVSVQDSSSTSCSQAQGGSATIIVHPTPTAVAPANQVYYSGFPTAPIALSGTPFGVTFNISGGAAAGLADVNGVTVIPSFIPTTTPATVTITPVANGCVGVPVTYQISFRPVIVNIESNVCGSINNGLNNQINCTAVTVPGYVVTGYQFEITNTDTGVVSIVQSSQHHFKLTDADNYAYGTTFTIRVAAILNGNVQGYFGNTCSLTTASVATTKVVTAQCGSTLLFINSTINANAVSSTNLYRFRISLASAPTTYYYIERTVPNFKLTDVVGLPLLFNTEYRVDVQIRVKLAGFEAWSQYGQRCSVFTPALPESSLVSTQCEDYQVPSYSTVINAVAFPGATLYRFRLISYDEFGDVNYQQTVDSPTASFTLSMFTGLTPSTTYTVSVSMQLYGTFTDYAKDCTIITPAAARQIDPTTVVEPFKASAHPNPFADNFMIDVKTTSSSVIAIKVYDMVGRLVEQRSVAVSELETSPIGDRYPSGVYNVVVTQDETVQTVRVVKR